MNTEKVKNNQIQKEILQEFLDKWKASEEILIGIGHELEIKQEDILEDSLVYQKIKKQVDTQTEEMKEWIQKSILFHEIEMKNERIKKQISFYNLLHNHLKGRPYFVVSTCMDGLITYSELDQTKTVTPCGDFLHGQCQDNCNPSILDTKEALRKIYHFLESVGKENLDLKQISDFIPICPSCQKKITFNHYKQKGYNENGYKWQWNEYLKWIQRTLNHKLLLVELGEGFKTPTVIRWPFERVTFLNQKAFLYRINKRFYQLTEELADKGKSIPYDSSEFLDQLETLWTK